MVEKRPVAPIDLTEKLACPMIGIFGNDDQNPNRNHVNATEAALKLYRQTGLALSRRGTYAKAPPEAVQEFLAAW